MSIRKENYALIIFALAIILIWLSPILFSSGTIGIYDWDAMMQRWEAVRITIMSYGQFPGNNPWVNGGQPLFIWSIFSIETLLSIILGTFWGLRLSIYIYACIGFYGAWKLSSIWWDNRFLRVSFSLYATFNTAVAFGVTVGHINFASTYWLFPLFLFYLLKLHDEKYSGLKAGVLIAMGLHITPLYILQYGLLISLIIFIYIHIFKNIKNCCKQVYLVNLSRWILQSFSIIGLLSFYRIIHFYHVGMDYSRASSVSNFSYSISNFFNSFIFPNISLDTLQPGWCGTTWELNGYLGVTAIILALVGLMGGIRWWHTITTLILWLASGASEWYHLMYWVHKIPTYSSHLCTTRVRYFAALFLGICAVHGMVYIYDKIKFHTSYSKYILLLCIALVMEVFIANHLLFRFSMVEYELNIDIEENSKFLNITELPRPPGLTPKRSSLSYFTTQKNIGWLKHGDSHLPVTNKLGYDQEEYLGEFYQNNTPLTPIYWSPNKILFEGLDPKLPLTLNMNPGRLWYRSNQPIFPEMKVVDMKSKFILLPDKDGSIEIDYRNPGSEVSLYGSIIFFTLFCGVLYFYREKKEINGI